LTAALSDCTSPMSQDLLAELYSSFEPFQPPRLEAYVDCQDVRGRWNVLTQLGREIIRSQNRATCQLFTGHRGVGKSTELQRLKAKLQQQNYFVVYFAADQDDIEPQDTEYADILFACTRQLFQQIQLNETQNPLWQWAKGRWAELASLALSKIKLEELSFEGPENPFAKISATLRAVPDKRRELRQRLNADTPSLIKALNEFIQEARKKLAIQGYQDIVIIADNLDRIAEKQGEASKPTNYDEIYLNRSEMMRGLNCHVIYTVPISMVYSDRATRLEDTYGKPDVLPMVMVRNPDRSFNHLGLKKLREIICQRTNLIAPELADKLDSDVFAGSDIIELLCVMSGGHVRNLMQMLRTAIDWTDNLPITANAIQIAIEETRDTYRDTVQDGQWQILAEVHCKNQIDNNEQHRKLLFNRCLLEYRYYDDHGRLNRWCNVHPLIEDLEQFQEALKQFQ
jgi:hypothetical protein